MTYIMLKATELLAARDPNVHARYHAPVHHRDPAGNLLQPHEVSPYLKGLCEVNINTLATPAIQGDAFVTESLARYSKATRVSTLKRRWPMPMTIAPSAASRKTPPPAFIIRCFHLRRNLLNAV